jgi:hypothetical protein
LSIFSSIEERKDKIFCCSGSDGAHIIKFEKSLLLIIGKVVFDRVDLMKSEI